jgi:glyoxylase-like metal-dependent hydrolase (beta-lactamase superfamily II)
MPTRNAKCHALVAVWTMVLIGTFGNPASRAGQTTPPSKPQPVETLRLYVLDCGMLQPTTEGVERYHVTTAEVGETRMPVPCFLIAHPRGTLVWDVGVIPDSVVESRPEGARANVNPTVAATVTRTLKGQLAQIGYAPADVTYVAISHAHIDHTANLSAFAASTWLTPQAERDFMWTDNNPRVNPSFYTALKGSKFVILDKDEHDVFGDGRVVIKAAPGHTPGHQVLILNLASTGRVMLSGDLYHYPQERTLRRAPPDNEFNVAQSAASRLTIESYLQKTGTMLWIEHDYVANAKLRKVPNFYD